MPRSNRAGYDAGVMLPILLLAMAAGEPLFVFDNGLGRGELAVEEQVALARRTGYAGVLFAGADNAEKFVAAHRAAGMRVMGIYTGVNLDDARPALEPGLAEAIGAMRGTGALVTFTVRGKGSAGADGRAAALIREAADLAGAAGLRVALYPHYGFYMARVEDGLRLREMAGRNNVGLVFNLCHWLRSGDGANLRTRLRAAGPHLDLVLINGSDAEGDWSSLIQTLDRGSYDVSGFLREIRAVGYKGPVGLQCYGIAGAREENLRRSMGAWRRMTAK